ncbi:hypothetical protein K490DRAFT_62330 [Saccharata proteae CBS 121410]|uniref:F-box domain-containing protein n=1 Tax=Saccharata proteae CBS 121410 TaxID=1314787 RepID=A0A9P4LZF0_9PEZI|nr:hypothetical protein K490DRAFT_62330 [Saccharata proteae CBS 121410]
MPRELAPDEYCELGRAYYAESNHKKALEAFTHAFNASTKQDIKFLDMRASVYEKLDDFNAALKDGRRMIQLGREDPRGYLRTARVLQRQEKSQLALDIYNLGLRRSSKDHHGSANFKLLQKLQNELSRLLSPPKSIDPLTVFPPEIVDLIMSHLNFRQQVNCLRVSKQWKRFLDSQESLWTNLDLSMAKRNVRPAFVRACIYRSNMHMKTAKFNRFRHEDMVWKLAKSCKQLESLHFLGSELSGSSIIEPAKMCQNLREIVVGEGAMMTILDLRSILKVAGRLASIDIVIFPGLGSRAIFWDVDVPNLRKLKLRCRVPGNTNCVVMDTLSLTTSAPNLIELGLSQVQLKEQPDFTTLTQLEELYVDRTEYWPLVPSCLRRLRVEDVRSLPSAAAAAIDLPHLEELVIANLTSSDQQVSLWDLLSKDEDGIVTIDPTWTDLKKLGVGLAIEGIADERFAIEYLGHPRLHRVEDLTISIIGYDYTGCAEYVLDGLPDLFPHLRRLSLPGSRATGADLRPLIEKMACSETQSATDNLGDADTTTAQDARSLRRPGIEYLNLDGCAHISADAIEWIRQRGIEVSHKVRVI